MASAGDAGTVAQAVVEIAVNSLANSRTRTLAAWSLVLEVLEDGEDPRFKGPEDDAPKVVRMWHVYLRADYTQAPWTVMLRHPNLNAHTSREAKTFCRRFRIPYVFFVELLQLVMLSEVLYRKVSPLV